MLSEGREDFPEDGFIRLVPVFIPIILFTPDARAFPAPFTFFVHIFLSSVDFLLVCFT
jgi:hypothetical protein